MSGSHNAVRVPTSQRCYGGVHQAGGDRGSSQISVTGWASRFDQNYCLRSRHDVILPKVSRICRSDADQ